MITKDGDLSVMMLPDKLTGKAVGVMLTTAKGELEKGVVHLVIDFSETVFVDSSGIGSLVSIAKDYKSRGKILSLRNLGEELRELFAETGLDMVFNIEKEGSLDNAKVDLFETGVDIKLEIRQDVEGDICLFHLSGVMNHPMGSRFFKQQFLLAMAHYKKLLLDFENLTFFDSLSVSVVLNMNKLLKETGGSLRLCAANYIVDDLFSTLNIGQIIPIFDDIATAKQNWA
jgi:anti-anti-sigma factor